MRRSAPEASEHRATAPRAHCEVASRFADAPASFRDEPKPLAFALGCLFTNVLARPQFIAYGPGKKPWTARLAEAMGAIRVCWTVRPEDDINAKEAENDAVIFEFYHPAPKYK